MNSCPAALRRNIASAGSGLWGYLGLWSVHMLINSLNCLTRLECINRNFCLNYIDCVNYPDQAILSCLYDHCHQTKTLSFLGGKGKRWRRLQWQETEVKLPCLKQESGWMTLGPRILSVPSPSLCQLNGHNLLRATWTLCHHARRPRQL